MTGSSGGSFPGTRLAAFAAALMAAGVALGAFGAHGLQDMVSEARLDTFETAARYHLIHAAALLAVAAGGRGFRAAWWIAAGVLVFSGSLYALSLTGMSWLGAVAPVGGVLMIGGWLALALAFLRPGAS